MRVSLSEIWGTVFTFVRAEASLLVPLTLSLLAIGRFGFDQGMTGLSAGGATATMIGVVAVTMVINVACLAAIRAMVLVPQISVGEAINLGFRRSPKILTLTVTMMLFLVAVAAPLSAATRSGNPDQLSMPMLLLGVGGIFGYFYVASRMLCFSAIIVDRDLPFFEALALSWRQTAPNHAGLFGMVFLAEIVGDAVGLGVAALLAVILVPLESLAGDAGLAKMLALFGAAMAKSLVVMAMAVFSAHYYRRVTNA